MQITKNQHYVPRVLLRNFAINDKVATYDLKRSQSRSNQHIDHVCSGRYTYDRDNGIENILSNELESPAGIALKQLLEENVDVRRPPTELLTFFLVQRARTREALDQTVAFVQSGFNALIDEIYERNGWEGRQASFVLTDNRDQKAAVLSYGVLNSFLDTPLISDLAGCLLRNTGSEEFIVSDHPVFQMNLYLQNTDDPRNASIAARGAQFFLPISPTLTYCLYDAKIYAYRGHSGCGVIEVGDADVRLLNLYQVINARELLVARSECMRGGLEDLAQNKARFERVSVDTVRSSPYVVDGESRSMQMTSLRLPNVNSLPSFVRLKKKAARGTVELGYRDEQFVQFHEAWRTDLKTRYNAN
jgi:hypothetical protein